MPRHDWPQESQCDHASDPTSAEVLRRLQAMMKPGALLGQISASDHELTINDVTPESNSVPTKASVEAATTSELDKNKQPCYHINMTQPNSIFSHADVPVDPEYLQRVTADHAGAIPELVFNDGTVEKGYDPEMLRALRKAALEDVEVPMPNFSSPDIHAPIPAPKHPVGPVKFSHAKKDKPAKVSANGTAPKAVFNAGSSISHTD